MGILIWLRYGKNEMIKMGRMSREEPGKLMEIHREHREPRSSRDHRDPTESREPKEKDDFVDELRYEDR